MGELFIKCLAVMLNPGKHKKHDFFFFFLQNVVQKLDFCFPAKREAAERADLSPLISAGITELTMEMLTPSDQPGAGREPGLEGPWFPGDMLSGLAVRESQRLLKYSLGH